MGLSRVDERIMAHEVRSFYQNRHSREWLWDRLTILLPHIEDFPEDARAFMGKVEALCGGNSFAFSISSPDESSEAITFPDIYSVRDYMSKNGYYRIYDGDSNNEGILLYDICSRKRMNERECKWAFSGKVVVEDGEGANGKPVKRRTPIAKRILSGPVDTEGYEVRFLTKAYNKAPLCLYYGEDGEPCINTWEGFGAKAISREKFIRDVNSDVSLMRALRLWVWNINHILASGDMAVAYDIWTWAAHLFQRTGEKPRVALCLKGVQGCGKGLFVELLGTMAGLANSNKITSLKEAVNGFNSSLVDYLFVNLDEYSSDEKTRNMMKSMITDERQQRTAKGVKERYVHTSTHFLMTTNNMKAFAVETGDRRHDVIEVRGVLAKDQYKGVDDRRYEMCDKYWTALSGSIEKVRNYMMFMLREGVDMSEWSDGGFKVTEEYVRQEELNKDSLLAYFEGKVRDGGILFVGDDGWEDYSRGAKYIDCIRTLADRFGSEYKVMPRDALQKGFEEANQNVRYVNKENFATKVHHAFGEDAICDPEKASKLYKDGGKVVRVNVIAFRKEFVDGLTSERLKRSEVPFTRAEFTWEYFCKKLGIEDREELPVDNFGIPVEQHMQAMGFLDVVKPPF
jgi:hypothetical protein